MIRNILAVMSDAIIPVQVTDFMYRTGTYQGTYIVYKIQMHVYLTQEGFLKAKGHHRSVTTTVDF